MANTKHLAGELAAVQQWQSQWQGEGRGLLHAVDKRNVIVTREGAQVPATHGSFDNNIDVVTQTIERMKGAAGAAARVAGLLKHGGGELGRRPTLEHG